MQATRQGAARGAGGTQVSLVLQLTAPCVPVCHVLPLPPAGTGCVLRRALPWVCWVRLAGVPVRPQACSLVRSRWWSHPWARHWHLWEASVWATTRYAQGPGACPAHVVCFGLPWMQQFDSCVARAPCMTLRCCLASPDSSRLRVPAWLCVYVCPACRCVITSACAARATASAPACHPTWQQQHTRHSTSSAQAGASSWQHR